MSDYSTAGTRAERRDHVEVMPAASRRISWGAVFGGAVLALAITLLLSLLGLGIGLTTIDPQQPDGSPSAGSLGIGASIWWLVSFIIALFVGGYTAARLAGVALKGDGVLHGLIAWAFTMLVVIYLLTSAIGSLVGGAFGTLSSVVSGAGNAAQSAASAAGDAAQETGIGGQQIGQFADQIIARVAPDASPQEVEQARTELVDEMQSLAPRLAQGDLTLDQATDRVSEILSRNLGVSVEEIRAEVSDAVDQARQQVAETAGAAADAASQAAFWSFVGLLVGAIAAAAGGSVGARPHPELATRKVKHTS